MMQDDNLDQQRSPEPTGLKQPRPPFASRAMSYISSQTNLQALLGYYGGSNAAEPEAKQNDKGDWPDFTAIVDETTAPRTETENSLANLRDRVWNYPDLPLGVEYNAIVLALTTKMYKAENEIKNLKEKIQQLEYQYLVQDNLIATDQGVFKTIHCRSCSCPSELRKLDNGSPTGRGRNEPTPFPAYVLPGPASADTFHDLGLPHPKFAGNRPHANSSSSSWSSSMGDDDTKARHEAAFELANKVWKKCGGQLETHYAEIAPILRVPTKLPKMKSNVVMSSPEISSSQPLQDTFSQPVPANGSSRERSRSNSSTLKKRRIFSFYPGDDNNNILDSLNEYAIQMQQHTQQPRILLHPSPEGKLSPQEPVIDEDPEGESQESARTDLGREDSNASVVTIVNVKKGKGLDGESVDTNRRMAKRPSGSRSTSAMSLASGIGSLKNAQRPSSQASLISTTSSLEASRRGSKPADKPQGPLAAAIAATARFGKHGKKTSKTSK